LPAITMFGFSTMPSRRTRWRNSASNTDSSAASVTSSQRSIVWLPSISTSGSTIGTIEASWHSAA
jgi:hypothetical protein